MNINGFDAGVAATVLPPIIAVINQHKWPPHVKGLVALAVCAAYSVGILTYRHQLHFGNWRDTMLTVAVATFGLHKLWWQPSGIVPKIETATTVTSPRPPTPTDGEQSTAPQPAKIGSLSSPTAAPPDAL